MAVRPCSTHRRRARVIYQRLSLPHRRHHWHYSLPGGRKGASAPARTRREYQYQTQSPPASPSHGARFKRRKKRASLFPFFLLGAPSSAAPWASVRGGPRFPAVPWQRRRSKVGHSAKRVEIQAEGITCSVRSCEEKMKNIGTLHPPHRGGGTWRNFGVRKGTGAFKQCPGTVTAVCFPFFLVVSIISSC